MSSTCLRFESSFRTQLPDIIFYIYIFDIPGKKQPPEKTTLEVQKNLEARCLSVCACFIIAATLWPNVSRRGHTKWKGSHAMEQKRESSVSRNPSVRVTNGLTCNKRFLTACEFRKTWQHMGVPSHESGAKTLLTIHSHVLFRIF